MFLRWKNRAGKIEFSDKMREEEGGGGEGKVRISGRGAGGKRSSDPRVVRYRLELYIAHTLVKLCTTKAEERKTRSGVVSKINRTRADRLSTCFNFPGYFAARGWGRASLFHGKIDEQIERKDPARKSLREKRGRPSSFSFFLFS